MAQGGILYADYSFIELGRQHVFRILSYFSYAIITFLKPQLGLELYIECSKWEIRRDSRLGQWRLRDHHTKTVGPIPSPRGRGHRGAPKKLRGRSPVTELMPRWIQGKGYRPNP